MQIHSAQKFPINSKHKINAILSQNEQKPHRIEKLF